MKFLQDTSSVAGGDGSGNDAGSRPLNQVAVIETGSPYDGHAVRKERWM